MSNQKIKLRRGILIHQTSGGRKGGRMEKQRIWKIHVRQINLLERAQNV